MPKVTVIIPTYNRRHIIGKAVESVLAQSEQDLEVIVVDDGSEDDTHSIIMSFNDDRISYFYKTNGGAASARNFGLSRAVGKYVAFLDSDDFWPDHYLKTMLTQLQINSEFGAAYSPITVIHPDGSKAKSYKRPEGKSGWITVDLFKRGFIWPSAVVFQKSVWENFCFDEALRTSEDSDAFLRLSMRTQFLFVPDVEAFHIISKDSLSAKEGIVCTRLLVLERFYFQLNGNKFIPSQLARRRLSHACRKVAEDKRLRGERAAALSLFRHAVYYWPADIRLYIGIAKTLLLSNKNDKEPNWKMPDPLGNPVGSALFG
ncbi:MAG: glycosyltransferase family 2 protein [Proteobacteria bacterium]|nr:glycosyltransferase family 2 protein [Pseudomonadota bacterium]MBU4037027.1 glycosyltransferase family 2 protein [Pseudomonadota bacterium]